MKSILQTALISIFIVISTAAIANYKGANKSVSSEIENVDAKPIHTLTSFTCVFAEGKTYLTWKVSNEEGNCVYAVEKSIDEQEFFIAGLKEGYGSKMPIALMYSWIDQRPIECTQCVHYRIKRINTQSGEVSYSDTLYLEADDMKPFM